MNYLFITYHKSILSSSYMPLCDLYLWAFILHFLGNCIHSFFCTYAQNLLQVKHIILSSVRSVRFFVFFLLLFLQSQNLRISLVFESNFHFHMFSYAQYKFLLSTLTKIRMQKLTLTLNCMLPYKNKIK